MKMLSLVVAALATLAISALAAEPKKFIVSAEGYEPITYIIPANSPVGQAKAVDKYGTAEFSGRFIVSGKYEYGWATDDPKDTDNYGEKFLTFTLDKQSVAKLPYWSISLHDANELEINNPEAFANAVIPKQQLAKLEARKIKTINGTTTIWIEKFQTHVECDHQYDTADFSSVVNRTYVASQQLSDGDGC